ncbi:hypothetical protein D3C75_585340 [compost metagenome]
MVFHIAAKQTVQRNQRRLTIQTLTVRRVTDNRTNRTFWQRVGQFSHVFDFIADDIAQTRTTGIGARAFDNPKVIIRTIETRSVFTQTFTRTTLRFGGDLFPQIDIVIRPAQETPVLAMQTRSAIGGDHCRFNQQRAGTAHRIEQRITRLPARTHHNGGCQRFFNRRGASAIAVAALMQAFAT